MPKVAETREIDELAGRMARVLESQRQLGGGAYPPTLERLAELSGVKASSPNVLKAVGKKAFKDRAVVAWNKDRKPARDAVVILVASENLEESMAEVAPTVLLKLLDRERGKSTEAFSATDLAKKLTAKLQGPFKAALARGIERNALPPEVGSIKKNNTRLLFMLDAVETSTPRPTFGSNGQAVAVPQPAPTSPGNFAEAFRAAFERLDRANRSTNFVRLLDMRRTLPGFDRERFDAGLRQLRLDDEFTLNSHEGRHGPLSDEEREAGIREAGSLLVYVSRRS
jgi:hypothetical protein